MDTIDGNSPYTMYDGPVIALWSVDLGGLDLSHGQVFFINTNAVIDKYYVGFDSHYFNISTTGAASSSVVVDPLLPATVIVPSIISVTQTIFQSATPTPLTSSTNSPTISPSSSHHELSGLSTGAAAGLGAGVAIGVLFVLSVAVYVWRQYDKKKVREVTGRDPHIASPFLINGEKSGFPLSTELDADEKRVSELPPDDIRRELATEERRGELDAIELQRKVEPVELPTPEVHGKEFRNSQARVERWSWEGTVESLDRGKADTESA